MLYIFFQSPRTSVAQQIALASRKDELKKKLEYVFFLYKQYQVRFRLQSRVYFIEKGTVESLNMCEV